MIDNTVNGIDLNYTKILDQCGKCVVQIAKQKADNDSTNEIKYKEAQAALTLRLWWEKLDYMMNKHIVMIIS